MDRRMDIIVGAKPIMESGILIAGITVLLKYMVIMILCEKRKNVVGELKWEFLRDEGG